MVVVAILAALGAASSNSLAAYFQQSADKDLAGDSVSLSDVPTLLRHPRWRRHAWLALIACSAGIIASGAKCEAKA